MNERFKPGEEVWVVERDECGLASGVAGFIFLAEVHQAIIVTPLVYGCDGVKEILDYHIGQTAEDFDADLAVYPAVDGYRSKSQAQMAMKEEMEDDDEQ